MFIWDIIHMKPHDHAAIAMCMYNSIHIIELFSHVARYT